MIQHQSLHDLIVDIHALDRELQRFEEKYSILSLDFYQLYVAGRLRDEEVEEIDEFGRWAALFQMRKRREQQYQTEKAKLFNAQQPSEPIMLIPYATSKVV